MAAGRKLQPMTADGPRSTAGKPLTAVPEPSSWLNDVAQQKYVEVCEHLVSTGSLCEGELPLVEQFAACYSRWRQAEEMLAAGDPGWRVVVTRQGAPGSTVPTAAMLQMRQSIDQMRRLGAALCLAPAERTRMPSTRDAGEKDAYARLLREAGVD